MVDDAPASEPRASRVPTVLLLLCVGAALVSVAWPFLAVPALVGVFLSGVAVGGKDRRLVVAAVVGGVAAFLGLGRFVVAEAAPGIVEAGQNAQARSAMYKLREIRLAEDGLRKTAAWDPDGDGVGSAGTLLELVGARKLRDTKALDFPALPTRWQQAAKAVEVADGDGGMRTVELACLEGYCFAIFIPDDDELAERHYVAYAWPEADDAVGRPREPLTTRAGDPRDVLRGQVLFLDEHERILESGNQQGYFGVDHIPTWDAALPKTSTGWEVPIGFMGGVGRDGGTWRPWKGKQPLPSLAGDR